MVHTNLLTWSVSHKDNSHLSFQQTHKYPTHLFPIVCHSPIWGMEQTIQSPAVYTTYMECCTWENGYFKDMSKCSVMFRTLSHYLWGGVSGSGGILKIYVYRFYTHPSSKRMYNIHNTFFSLNYKTDDLPFPSNNYNINNQYQSYSHY